MNIIDIIETKKNKQQLTKEQISFWIDGMMKGNIEDYQTSALLMAICLNGFNEEESVQLTKAMLNSGESLDLSDFYDISVDKHSSGGVGDSTTFIVIPALAALGYKCAKASGRGLGHTGGTLDKLESIKGFNINLTKEEFFNQVKKVSLAIVGQSKDICPADKKLYALRDVTATVDNIGLIAASIMSKKLASGAKNIVLDVKCGKGAFMKKTKDAILLAERMVKIGKQMGRNITAVVSNMDYPLDNYVGNSLEILGALKVLEGQKNDLYKVAVTLASVLLTSMGVEDAKKKVQEVIENKKALEKFYEMIECQNGDVDFVKNKDNLLSCKNIINVYADKEGYIVDVEPIVIANTVKDIGGGREKVTDDIDLYCGIEIKVNINDYVKKGDLIARVYSNVEKDVYDKTLAAFKIEPNPIKTPTLIYKIIS